MTGAEASPTRAVEVEGGVVASPPRDAHCPVCSETVSCHRNQYFGVGLAVHEWLYVCGHCGQVGFFTLDELIPEAPVTRGSRGRRRLLRFLTRQAHGG